MPIKFANKILAMGGFQIAGDGIVQRDLSIPWQSAFLAACPVTNMSGSVAAFSLNVGAALRYNGTKNTCPIILTMPVPQDAATGVTYAASGTVYVDWTDLAKNSAVASVPASLYLVPNGSAIGDSGTSTLGAAASGVTITGTTACELSSTSLFSFTAPATRSGFFVLKTIVDSNDAANTSGSDFCLFGFRIRYNTDRLGT